MSKSTIIPIPKTASGLPKQPIEVIRYVRQFLRGDLEHTVCTLDGKQWLGRWLDRFLSKAEHNHQPIDQVLLTGSEKCPFVARCGRLLVLVDQIDVLDAGFQVIRGTILEGKHFDDRGDYAAGDRVSIGPISEYWRRITLPKSGL